MQFQVNACLSYSIANNLLHALLHVMKHYLGLGSKSLGVCRWPPCLALALIALLLALEFAA